MTTIKIYNLSSVRTLIRHGEDHFCLSGRRAELHVVLCDDMHSYFDWFFELTDLLEDIQVLDLPELSGSELRPLRAVAGEKYKLMPARRFNNITILAITSPEIRKTYLLTKTMRKVFTPHGGFDASSGKIKGSYGKIHAAMAMRGNKLLAVKDFRHVAKAGTTKVTDQEAMMREMRTMQKCHCRLKTYDVLEIGPKAYCVMDYMDGTLEQYVRWAQQAGLTKDDKKWIGRIILKELAFDVWQCHRVNFAHRDIKPENLLLSQNCVRLTDYGFAHRGPVPVPDLRGSPKYLTAWNMENEIADKALDIYNMGLTWLYYMLGDHLLKVVGQPGNFFLSHTEEPSEPQTRASPATEQLFRDFYLEYFDEKQPPRGIRGKALWRDSEAVRDTYWAALAFEYFHTRVYRTGRLNRGWGRLPQNLRFWEPVEARLKAARDCDPDLFKFVWERMLVQDPASRATADEVHRTLRTLTRNAMHWPAFNHVLEHDTPRSRREGLQRAFYEAQRAFRHDLHDSDSDDSDWDDF
jgi:serine/threonine protein kinase